MDTQSIILLTVILSAIIGGVGFVIVSQIKSLKSTANNNDQNAVLMEFFKEMKSDMKLSVEKNTDALESQLKEQRQAMGKQTELIWQKLDNASSVIKTVQMQMSGIQEFGTDIKDLSNILKSPKMRGGLGEQFLYEILENSLPKELFKTQYKFKGGAIADAVIKTDKGLIPIDSKFSMENFKNMVTGETQENRDKAKKEFVKDVKKRIDEISSKYILPEENTTEFAVMYVPSENVFYELIVNTPEIEDYARIKNIFITSPNTLNYQIKSILVAFQQNELQKHTGEILKALAGIKIEAEKFNGDLDVLEGHVSNSYKIISKVRTNFSKLFGKIESAAEIGEPEQKPLLEA